jgi:hypothetical protein
MTISKEEIMKMAVDDVENLLIIVGDLTHLGYRISLCRLRGSSINQCAQKFKTTPDTVRYYFKKCGELHHTLTLKRIFNI